MPKGIKGFQNGHIPYTNISGDKNPAKNPDVAKRISEANKGRTPPNKGKKTGKHSHNWKGGTSIRKQEAKIRDDYTCQVCGLREPEIMEVDHIFPKSRFKDKEFELENLITLCPNCHRRKTNRDKKQYNLYKNVKASIQY